MSQDLPHRLYVLHEGPRAGDGPFQGRGGQAFAVP